MTTPKDEHPVGEQPAAEPAPALPDYLSSPNAILGDTDCEWRYGEAPNYSKTRKVWEETKKSNHTAGSLPQLVENLVKNWEVEASFKPRLSDWRTVDHANYTFSINGGTPQTAEHMLKVGTYNAIVAPNEFYSPAYSDFASSHKTFKHMMPTFAWEVLEVYSGPPRVAFRWRHWGVMQNDYVGFNDKGEKVTAKAHGGPIDISGVTVATVDEQVRLQAVDTYFDPLDMFRQIAQGGIVDKVAMNHTVDNSVTLDDGPVKVENAAAPAVDAVVGNAPAVTQADHDDDEIFTTTTSPAVEIEDSTSVTEPAVHSEPESSFSEEGDKTWEKIDRPVDDVPSDISEPSAQDSSVITSTPFSNIHSYSQTMEDTVHPSVGEAIAVPAEAGETQLTHEEMSRLTIGGQCPFMGERD